MFNVGYCYDTGTGVRPSRSAALYWYKRAYRRGDGAAARAIGMIWNDKQNLKRALYWFQRAVTLGDDDSNLQIARLHIRSDRDASKAIPYLKLVCQSGRVTEETAVEARKLLKRISFRKKGAGS